jgi:hypothetical protein
MSAFQNHVEKTCGNQVPQHTISQNHDSRQTQHGKPPLVQSKQNERKRKDQHNTKILKHLKTPPNLALTEHIDPSDTKKTAGQNNPEAQPHAAPATQPELTPNPTLQRKKPAQQRLEEKSKTQNFCHSKTRWN